MNHLVDGVIGGFCISILYTFAFFRVRAWLTAFGRAMALLWRAHFEGRE